MIRWQKARLGEIAQAMYGYTESASFKEIGPKFLRITDLQNNGVVWDTVPHCKIDSIDLGKYTLKDGDIVFARTGATTGKSYLVRKPPLAVFASYLIKLRVSDGRILPDFLYKYFQTQEYWDTINSGVSGSAQGGFNASKLSELHIPLPPLPEQKRIVAILDEAFSGIARAKEIAEKNLANARVVFESYLQNVFANVGTGIGSNRLEDCCKLIVDCEHKTAPVCKDQNTGYYSIRTPNIGKGNLLYEEANQVTEETYIQWTRRAIPRPGDLIFAREAPAGNIAIIPENVKVCLGQRTVLIRVNRNILIPQFLTWVILAPRIQNILLHHSRGATVAHVNMKDIRNLPLNELPSLAAQQNIVNKLDSLMLQTNKLEVIYSQKKSCLEALKTSLLHQAFTGALS